MPDKFSNVPDHMSAPARHCFVITPHATNELPIIPKAIRAPSDGVITLRAVDSDEDVAHPVLEGEVINVRVRFVRESGTNIIGTIVGYA